MKEISALIKVIQISKKPEMFELHRLGKSGKSLDHTHITRNSFRIMFPIGPRLEDGLIYVVTYKIDDKGGYFYNDYHMILERSSHRKRHTMSVCWLKRLITLDVPNVRVTRIIHEKIGDNK